MEIDINKPFGEVIAQIARQWNLESLDGKDMQVKVCSHLTSKNLEEFVALINNKGDKENGK
ncbi:hypothetical protein [Clostridium sp.]|uniref:hypothetical protein n=1 Tax=Clostridium sp. TaxID=1506 RepID=UPI001A4B8AAE|nr:hypothetical protein [Clostridium sp.]MBK5239821.1 hypothetical protein [Clostridium sp.]